MKLVACAVYDEKARAFMVPFFTSNTATAVRSFISAARSEGQLIADHPADFTLYHIGSFDDATGRIDMFDHKITLGNGKELREAQNVRKIA